MKKRTPEENFTLFLTKNREQNSRVRLRWLIYKHTRDVFLKLVELLGSQEKGPEYPYPGEFSSFWARYSAAEVVLHPPSNHDRGCPPFSDKGRQFKPGKRRKINWRTLTCVDLLPQLEFVDGEEKDYRQIVGRMMLLRAQFFTILPPDYRPPDWRPGGKKPTAQNLENSSTKAVLLPTPESQVAYRAHEKKQQVKPTQGLLFDL
jgi:hypothetical protein